MEPFVDKARLPDLPAATGLGVHVNERPIALLKVDGEVFAVDDGCALRREPRSRYARRLRRRMRRMRLALRRGHRLRGRRPHASARHVRRANARRDHQRCDRFADRVSR